MSKTITSLKTTIIYTIKPLKITIQKDNDAFGHNDGNWCIGFNQKTQKIWRGKWAKSEWVEWMEGDVRGGRCSWREWGMWKCSVGARLVRREESRT